MTTPFSWRNEPEARDIEQVRLLVAATGFFTPAEIAIAAELVEERLADGPDSGYHFVLADCAAVPAGSAAVGDLAAFACFGPITLTESAFDLYWIATHPRHQGKGLGRATLARAEAAMRTLGASRHYAETSSTALYAPTRDFYQATGFRLAAQIPDFYRTGDDKIIYERLL